MKPEGTPVKSIFKRERASSSEGIVEYGHIEREGSAPMEPVMVLPGYGLSLPFNESFAEAIADPFSSGDRREVFVVQHARKGFDLKKDFDHLYPNAPKLAKELDIVTLRRAHEAIVVLEKTHSKAHLVGHSFGGMVIVAIALLRPDLVRSLTLINAGGLVGHKNPVGFFFSFLKNWLTKETSRRGSKKSIWPVIRETLFSYMRQAPLRSMREELVVSTTDIGYALGRLAEQGLPITVIYDSADEVFKAEEVEKWLGIGSDIQPRFRIVRTEGKMHYGPVMEPLWYGELLHKTLEAYET